MTALPWHLYPCGDGGAHSSWVECLEVMTLDFFRGQPVAKMIVLMDSFRLDPSQLSWRRRGVGGVSRAPVYVFMMIITNLALGKGDSWSVCMCPPETFLKLFPGQKRGQRTYAFLIVTITIVTIFQCFRLKSITLFLVNANV